MAKVIMINTKTRTVRVENADKNIDWITIKGTHVPIEKGQSKSAAVKSFVEKKRPAQKENPDAKYAEYATRKNREEAYKRLSKSERHAVDTMSKWKRGEITDEEFVKRAQQPAKPSKKADVSDIVKSYKEKMAAVGPRASIRKTDRIEADAIKEFMTRKLGANRPYDDYYNYWLSGMDKATKDAFNEIYNESEAREMAFSELASDVDHSGMARGEPTYDELMQWSEKQKAKKAQQQPAKASSEKTKEIDAKIKDKKRELENIIRSLSQNVETGYFDIAQEMMTDVEYVKGELQQLMDERAKLQQQPAKKD